MMVMIRTTMLIMMTMMLTLIEKAKKRTLPFFRHKMQLSKFLLFTGLLKICPLFHWLPEPLNLSFFRVPIVCQLIYGGKGFKTPAPPTRQIGFSHPVHLSHLWPQPEHEYMFLKQFQFSRPFSVSEDHHFPPLFPLSE